MSVDDFLELVLRSRLLEFTTLRRILDHAPQEAYDSPQKMAEWLAASDHLTRYQAANLLNGNWQGLVVDRYELCGFLGRGGMGNVYLALERKTRQPYAIKVLLPELREKTRSVLRFQREMQVSRSLQHPGLAKAYEAGIWKGIHFLVMEYVPGPTLYRYIRKRGRAEPYWAARWIGEVAGALDYAHQSGVVHRDLKPSNVIILRSGQVKLLDLGLARWFDDDHNEDLVLGRKRIVGSFDYIAPEQAVNSARADARSDIYGIGCLLYFALVGRPPFHHVSKSQEKIVHHKRVQPVPIRKRRPEIPADLAEIVGKMMAKDPRERYQVAAQVRDELGSWCSRWIEHTPPPPFFDLGQKDEDNEEIPSAEEPVMLDEQDSAGSDTLSALPTVPMPEGEEGPRFWGRMSRGLSRWFSRGRA